jgi:hypothetical protein
MTGKTLTRLKLGQWKTIIARSDNRYSNEVLGGVPSSKTVDKRHPNENPVTYIEWAFIFFALAIIGFAMTKIVPSAAQYAITFYDGSATEGLPTIIRTVFIGFTVLVMSLLNSVGFLMFKRMTEEPEIIKKKRENPIKWTRGDFFGLRIPTNILAIEVWSPRIFDFLTYLVLVWQILIAIVGIHDYKQAIQWVNAILPVLSEIALATLLNNVLGKTQDRHLFVTKQLLPMTDEYERKYEKRHNDERYWLLVFQEMREKLVSIGYFWYRPNKWLELASDEVTRQVAESEFKRLELVGIEFAKGVFAIERMKQDVVDEIVSEDEGAAELHNQRRIPPRKMSVWTIKTLTEDFMARNMSEDMEYTEKLLSADYLHGYGARSAWRQGAKAYFKCNRSE